MFLSLHLLPHSGKWPLGVGSVLLPVVGTRGEACRWGEVVPGPGRIIGDQVMRLWAGEQGRACRRLATVLEIILFRLSTMETQMPLAKPDFQLFFFSGPDGWSPNTKHENSVESMHWGCRV